jgi:hypothetical protein
MGIYIYKRWGSGVAAPGRETGSRVEERLEDAEISSKMG